MCLKRTVICCCEIEDTCNLIWPSYLLHNPATLSDSPKLSPSTIPLEMVVPVCSLAQLNPPWSRPCPLQRGVKQSCKFTQILLSSTTTYSLFPVCISNFKNLEFYLSLFLDLGSQEVFRQPCDSRSASSSSSFPPFPTWRSIQVVLPPLAGTTATHTLTFGWPANGYTWSSSASPPNFDFPWYMIRNGEIPVASTSANAMLWLSGDHQNPVLLSISS